MTEALPILLHPVVALLYALTAWLCFPQARQASGAARHVNALVALALLLHAIGLGRAIFTPTGVDLSFTHALSLVAGLAVLVAWATGLIRALPAVGAVVLPVAAVAAVLPVMGESARRLPYADVPWASVHITIALCAYAILIVAAAEALVLTGIERRLHRALPNPGVAASPPLLTLERWLFLLIGIGYVLLTLTVASGIFYSSELFGTPARFNQKNVFAVAAWATYTALLVGRWRYGWRGRRALKWILAGTLLLLAAYVGSKFVLEVLQVSGVRNQGSVALRFDSPRIQRRYIGPQAMLTGGPMGQPGIDSVE
ncbi:MAG: cytochrome c biogenesis protein CcsA [Casimicrobiaceae bacterium]